MPTVFDCELATAKCNAAAEYVRRTAGTSPLPGRAAAVLADATVGLTAATDAMRAFPGPEFRGAPGRLVPVNFYSFNATLAAVQAQARAALDYADGAAAEFGPTSDPRAWAVFEAARDLCRRNLDGYRFAEPLRPLTRAEMDGPSFDVRDLLADARAALAAER